MNLARDLLMQCKIKLEIKSNYQLAKKLEMHSGLISDYMNGKRIPNPFAAVQIAKCLEINPLLLIAEFEELSAKNEKEKEIWQEIVQECKTSKEDTLNKLIIKSLSGKNT